MLKSTWILAAVAVATLAACVPTTDVKNAAIGAGVGAGLAAVTGGDVKTGAALGGIAGALANDAGIVR